MASLPSVGPTWLREMTFRFSGRAPPLTRVASWSASSRVKLPVIWVDPPWIPTLHCTLLATGGELMTSLSSTMATRRLGSPSGLQAAAPVRVSHCRLPAPLKSMTTKRPMPVVGSVPTLASPMPSPVRAAGPMTRGRPESSVSVCWGSVGSNGDALGDGAGEASAAADAVGAAPAGDGAAGDGAAGLGAGGEAAGLATGPTCAAGWAAASSPFGSARPLAVGLVAGAGAALATGAPLASGAPLAAAAADGCGIRLVGSAAASTGWMVSCAVLPMTSAAWAASSTPGSSTMIRRSPERASVGSVTPSESTRRRSTSSARSVFWAFASVVGVLSVSKVIEVPPRRSSPSWGFLVITKNVDKPMASSATSARTTGGRVMKGGS